MKQILLKTWLILVCLLTGAGTMWAEEVVSYTFETAKSGGNTAYATNYDVTISNVKWSCPGNQNFSGYVRIGGKSLSNTVRDIYSKDFLSDDITKVVLNHNGVSHASLNVNSITLTVASDADFTSDVQTKEFTSPSVSSAGSLSFSPSTGTWGAKKYFKISFNLTNSKTSNYGLDVTSIVFYKNNGGTTSEPEKPTPSLSFANPTYNATMGEDFTAPSLTNEQDVAVTYTSSKTNVATVDETSGAITLVAPGTTKITASFAGDETYNGASASYDLVVASAPLSTMDAIYAKAQEANNTEADVNVKFNNWVVSGVNGSNAYVTDGTKGFIIYKSGHNFVAGDVLSGTVSAKIKMFNNAAEFTTITSTTEGLTVTKGGSVSEQTIAIADLAGVNTGALVAYEDLTYRLNGTSAEFSDGENVIVAYKGIMNALPELVEGKTYDVKGIFLMYGTKKEILPRSAEDIVLKENLNKYVVTIETPENGTLTVKDGETVVNDGDEVAEGTELTIECTPANADYRLVNWQYKEGEAAWATRTKDFTYTMPSANVQFKANFELIPVYTVAFSVNGTIIQTNDLKDGAAVTAPDEPEAINGKVFTGWIETATVEGATPAYVTPATATKTVTYYAVFATQTGSGEAKYELVESALDNWAGDYLIVYNNTYAMNTHSGNQNANTYATYADISEYYTEATKSIASNSTTDALVYRAAQTTNGYSLYCVSDESYLGITAKTTSTGAKLRWNTSYTESADDWTLGVGSVGNVGSNTLYIRWNNNSGSYRFAAYALTGQQAVQLFKKEGGATYSDYCTTVVTPLHKDGVIKFVGTTGEGKYYATFSSTRAIKFDEAFINDAETCMASVKAYAVTTIDGQLYRTDQYNVNNDGNYTYIPANTGILFEYTLDEDSEEFDGEVPYEYADAEADYLYAVEDNMLVACPTTGACPTVEGTNYYYKLAYGDNTNQTKLGFWWGAEGGGNLFNVKAGGAVLVVPQSVSSNLRGFRFDDDPGRPTGIESISNDVVAGEIYNLQGQCINRLQQGVNIVNGRKVIR